MNVGIQWTRYFFSQHLTKAFTGGATDNLAYQESERVDVVAVRRTRRPPRSFRSKRLGHCVPIEHCAFGQRRAQSRQACAMREKIAQGDVFLPIRGKLRPEACNRCVKPNPVALHQAQSALLTEKKLTNVSRRHGLLRAPSAQPPHRSATTRPRIDSAMAAPGSPRSAKLAAKASRNRENSGSQKPSITEAPCPLRYCRGLMRILQYRKRTNDKADILPETPAEPQPRSLSDLLARKARSVGSEASRRFAYSALRSISFRFARHQ